MTSSREESQNRPVPNTPLPEELSLAMAYIPFQTYGDVFPAEKALEAGTLFPDLDKPFYGRRGGMPR